MEEVKCTKKKEKKRGKKKEKILYTFSEHMKKRQTGKNNHIYL
jgi:hypothetical protein